MQCLEVRSRGGEVMRFKPRPKVHPWAERAGLRCTLMLSEVRAVMLSLQRLYQTEVVSELPPEIERLLLTYVYTPFQVQAGARVVYTDPSGITHKNFERWTDGSELSCDPQSYLEKRLRGWEKTNLLFNVGEDYEDYIEPCWRTVMLLDPTPIFEKGTDMERYADETQARRNHCTLCWNMRQIAALPFDTRDMGGFTRPGWEFWFELVDP